MNCVICEHETTKVAEMKPSRYRDETVEVSREFFRCENCKEEFATPEQMRVHVRAIKNEIRKKHGLLSPDKIVEIRTKLGLKQDELEELLGTGPKVVVRWESGKVIQSGGHDNMLRLLEREPSLLQKLRKIQELRSQEQKEYVRKHANPKGMVAQAHAM